MIDFFSDPPILEIGSEGFYVRVLQALLNLRLRDRPPLPVSGRFDMATYNALYEFRTQHYLNGDTVTDRLTWEFLLDEERS